MDLLVDESLSTRNIIITAFMKLLEKFDFEQITVKEIVKKSGISRSTFYLHFEDKYDLFEKVTEQIVGEFLSIYQDPSFTPTLENATLRNQRIYQLNVQICEHIRIYYYFYQLRLKDTKFVAYFTDCIKAILIHPFETVPMSSFAAHGTVGYLFNWVNDGLEEDVHTIAMSLTEIGMLIT